MNFTKQLNWTHAAFFKYKTSKPELGSEDHKPDISVQPFQTQSCHLVTTITSHLATKAKTQKTVTIEQLLFLFFAAFTTYEIVANSWNKSSSYKQLFFSLSHCHR